MRRHLCFALYPQGNVEHWLGELLVSSQQSVHSVIRSAAEAIADQQQFNLIEFENEFPAQIGLLGLQLLWTRDAQTALMDCKYDRRIMHTTNNYFLQLLNLLIGVTAQDLSKFDRVKFETLITIHVHQRDIFNDLVSPSIIYIILLVKLGWDLRYRAAKCIISGNYDRI